MNSLGWVVLVGLVIYGIFRKPDKKPTPDPSMINDGNCHCGSHTHPGFNCSRCGGLA